jgi:peptidylprolyl isomerase
MNELRKVAVLAAMVSLLAACESKPAPTPQGGTPSAQAPADATKAGDEAKPAEQQGGAAAVKPPDAAKPADPHGGANNPFAPPGDVAKPPADAVEAGGVFGKVLKAGDGTEKPNETDVVEVHYTGWTTDGKMFDSSVRRGQPIKFPLDGVIPGWREGVKQMVKGEKRRIWIPEELAYKGVPGAPQGMLVFDIELLSITVPPKIDTPEDVAAPPKTAETHESGIFSRVLAKGTGKEKPTDNSLVKAHYSGWTTDGKMFDSSVRRGEPAMFPVGQVIPGWREAVKLMVVGEKRRVWIPEDLAYKNGPPGAPQGMLVFDIELVEIKEMPKPMAMPPGMDGHGHGHDHDGHGHDGHEH